MYNAICTAKGSALFSHAGMFLSSSEGGNERSQSEAILETNGSGVMRVDPMLPLCTYELCGRCTDEVLFFAFSVGHSLSLLGLTIT